VEFLNHFDGWIKTKEAAYLNVGEFQRFLNEKLLPSLTVEELKELEWPICKETARVWMHRLGFGYGTYVKDIYIVSHD